MPRSRTRSGFTMIEMMLVLSILGILAAIAAPRLRSALADARMRGAKTTLAAAVVSARAAAVQHGGNGRFRLESGKAWAESGPAGAFVVVADTVKLGLQYNVTATPTSLQINFGSRGIAVAGPAAGQLIVLTGELGRVDSLCITTLGVLVRRGCGA
jgi:prepilin-type N-terminal cleavage/methylation domain-containing protein